MVDNETNSDSGWLKMMTSPIEIGYVPPSIFPIALSISQ